VRGFRTMRRSRRIKPERKGSRMMGKSATNVHRRDLFRLLLASAAAVVGTAGYEAAAAEAGGRDGKRKARYRADSVEVQSFYRVNRYPAR
jgi:hypothetical protein